MVRKSGFAERLAHELEGKRAYIATAQALDPEMAARIEKHRKDRGKVWDTYESRLPLPNCSETECPAL
jgi:adenosylcobinamide kinase/adenosylcobinamide-phosphate guanylyltransferase